MLVCRLHYAFVDTTHNGAIIFYLDRTITGNELRYSVERLGIISRHLLLSRLIWPVDWRKHQQISVGAGFEEFPAWIVKRRETLVLHRDYAVAGLKRLAGYLALAMRNTGRNQDRAMTGGRERFI